LVGCSGGNGGWMVVGGGKAGAVGVSGVFWAAAGSAGCCDESSFMDSHHVWSSQDSNHDFI
jgi:hypothetical protein